MIHKIDSKQVDFKKKLKKLKIDSELILNNSENRRRQKLFRKSILNNSEVDLKKKIKKKNNSRLIQNRFYTIRK